MSATGETQEDPEEIMILSELQSVNVEPPNTPSGLVPPSLSDQSTDPANLAVQQSGPVSKSREDTPPAVGVAFSGGGIRSAAFCSGALRWMLQNKVPMEYLSCVSGGGYTGAAFLERQRREKNKDDWHEDFFEKMRYNAGYICNWQKPCLAIGESLLFIIILFITVVLLPCWLWLPYALPVAETVDFFFGDILRENSTCRGPVKESLKSSYLLMEIYSDCSPSSRRVALFCLTSLPSLAFYILSRCRRCRKYRGHLRLLSVISGLVFAFTLIPWLAHDFLWPAKAWIKVLVFFICLILPFFIPVIRNYAGIFLFFFAYSYVISWKVFKTELFGTLPYSDAVFYPVLVGCGMSFVVFPFIGSVHQTLFNVYYRWRLSKAFFKRPAKFRWKDIFPCCVRAYEGVPWWKRKNPKGKGCDRSEYSEVAHEDSDVAIKNKEELTLDNLKDLRPQFISNITVNDWQMHKSRAGPSHHLMAFSPKEVKVIGKHVDENGKNIEPPVFNKCFLPEHMRLSSAMAISGAAVSFDMGSYDIGLDMVLELLALLGIGMGDEMASNQCEEEGRGWCSKFLLPFLLEILICVPLIAIMFVYFLSYNTGVMTRLVILHVAVVVFLAVLAVLNTGSPQQGKNACEGSSQQGKNACNTSFVIRWLISRIFFIRFLRGFLNIPNVGTNPPPVLRLSDGGHFENLALLPLLALEKKLKQIIIVDGSCNPGGDKYADALLHAIKTAREKLHCSFEGMDGRDIEEDIRVKFLSKQENGQLRRHYKFKVRYYDNGGEGTEETEILFIAPRHPSETRPVTEEPQPPVKLWKDVKFGDERGKKWGGTPEERWGTGPEMTKDEVDRLTWCCCHCCHRNCNECKFCCLCCTCRCSCDCCPSNICHDISSFFLGAFPHHKTANQFFTPDMFSAYHREGYAACVEAENFFKKIKTEES